MDSQSGGDANVARSILNSLENSIQVRFHAFRSQFSGHNVKTMATNQFLKGLFEIQHQIECANPQDIGTDITIYLYKVHINIDGYG